MKTERFNENDIRIVRKDYMNNILPASGVFLFFVFITLTYFSLRGEIDIYFYLTLLLSLGCSFVFFVVITRKQRLDLSNQLVMLEKTKIRDKVYKKDYEPGSATVPVNFVSLLFFKKIFLRKMKELHIYYLLIDDLKLLVTEEDYNKFEIGEEIITRWSENTKLFLGIIKDNQHIRIATPSGVNRLYI